MRLKIGQFGFGCVGQGFYQIIKETSGSIADIKKICVKNREKERHLASDVLTFDKDEILFDDEINVVVELIDDSAAAFELLKDSLRNGKHFVTANKKMVAEHLEEIYNLQRAYNRSVLYEAAICGSIPILRTIEGYYDSDSILSIGGIFNGSTNYILTKVFEEKKTYQEALQLAQIQGFAERDPSLDVEAIDPKFKLIIVIAHAFGLFLRPEDVVNIGIQNITMTDIKYALGNNLTIKLVAKAFEYEQKVFAWVAPQFIHKNQLLAAVSNEDNVVMVEGLFSKKQHLIGKGAGGQPTGLAVYSDICSLINGYRYKYRRFTQTDKPTFSNDAFVDVMISFSDKSQISPNEFEKFIGWYSSNGHQYMAGKIDLRKIRRFNHENMSVILDQELPLAK